MVPALTVRLVGLNASPAILTALAGGGLLEPLELVLLSSPEQENDSPMTKMITTTANGDMTLCLFTLASSILLWVIVLLSKTQKISKLFHAWPHDNFESTGAMMAQVADAFRRE